MKSELIVKERHKWEKWFATKHLREDIRGHSLKGGISTIGSQMISFFLNITNTIVMARLLLPEDFGLVAMVTAVTGFVTIFGNLNLAAAIIQKDEITHRQVSAVFWINLLITTCIAILVAGMAPILAHFYSEKRLVGITLILALNIFLNGFWIQHDALMKRQMRFKSISKIQIGSVTVSLLSGILLALSGFGYLAIVLTYIVSSFIQVVAYWTVCDWRPGFFVRSSKTSSLVGFGASLTGAEIFTYFSRNMDNVIIGKYLGSAALGLYTKAYQILVLPITQLRSPLNSVALPAMSALQHDETKYVNFYSRYVFILAFFSMPLVVYLGLYSDELILFVLGEKWVEAGYIFRLLAISGFITPVTGTLGLVLTTTGRAKKNFIWGIVNAAFLIPAFYLGVQWNGVEGLCIASVIVNYLLFIPYLYYCSVGSPITTKMFLKEISLPMFFSIISGVSIFWFKNEFNLLLHDQLLIIRCIVGFFIGLFIYLILWQIFPSARNKFLQLMDIVSYLKNKV